MVDVRDRVFFGSALFFDLSRHLGDRNYLGGRIMVVLGIDPGPESLALASWDGSHATFLGEVVGFSTLKENVRRADLVGVEDFITYRPLDASGRETIKMIGVVRYICEFNGTKCIEIPRAKILRWWCGDTKGGDVALRVAVYDRFGGSRQAAIGTKKIKGPLYGLKGSHLLAALAVAVMGFEKSY